jgi:hypothetical protein
LTKFEGDSFTFNIVAEGVNTEAQEMNTESNPS